MATERGNLLIGHGERLFQAGVWKSGGSNKPEPYTREVQLAALSPGLSNVIALADQSPSRLAPRGEVAAKLTVHPQFLAKTYFPDSLLRHTGLRLLGSKETKVAPRRMVEGKPVKELVTATLLVAGNATAYSRMLSLLQTGSGPAGALNELNRVEALSELSSAERIRGIDRATFDGWIEVVLHASLSDGDVIDEFVGVAKGEGADINRDRARTIGGLTFMPLRLPADTPDSSIETLARFTHVRALRNMPLIGTDPLDGRPDIRGVEFAPALPTEPALDQETRAVIFDGGSDVRLRWVSSRDAAGVPSGKSSLSHGESVTSAFLFGAVPDGNARLEPPYCNVEHVRVLPSAVNDMHARDVIDWIMSELQRARDEGRPYALANLSLGPRTPIVDDDPHEWTVRLDDFLSLGDLFMTVACGNDGSHGQDLGRLQPPADGVNLFSVGASDGSHGKALRAPYSCWGPGRSPGIVKPDVVAFGGAAGSPLKLVDVASGMLMAQAGTSFSAPLALRLAAGVRSSIAEEVSATMLHALLVSRAQFSTRHHDQLEVGWGVLPASVTDVLYSPQDEVVVLFQGKIAKGQPLRVPIPVPHNLEPDSDVHIGATFSYRAPIDPAHPVAYTRAGLEIRFMPDGETSDTFFSKTNYDVEQDLRQDAMKWEACRHRSKRKKASTLVDPCFVIRYQGRDEGGDDKTQVLRDRAGDALPADRQPGALPFALVVRIRVPGVVDLSSRVLSAYRVLSEVKLRSQARATTSRS